MYPNQPQYNPLPALVLPGDEGEVITFWQFSDEELEQMIKQCGFYLSQLVFTHENDKGERQLNALQPILPLADLSDRIKFE